MLIDGKKIAESMLARLAMLRKPQGKLVAVVLGDDPASLRFVLEKRKVAERLGIAFVVERIAPSVSQAELESAVRSIGESREVGGVILQLPLPRSFDRDRVITAIPREKDVDALSGRSDVRAPTVVALDAILQAIHFSPKGKQAAVVGRGFLVGQPIARWLADEGSGVKMLSSEELDREALRSADLIVAGSGKPRLITGDLLARGVVAIDFGYAREGERLVGDLDASTIEPIASFMTPTPGGTGPIVVAALFENFYTLASNF
jgi:methylenetetrahydrofolate dehydrogenase (NADP+)/methenyltetrahydrofolate cyclohydrolase